MDILFGLKERDAMLNAFSVIDTDDRTGKRFDPEEFIQYYIYEKKKNYNIYWGYTSSDDSPITDFFTTDSFEIEDKDFYLNGMSCVW